MNPRRLVSLASIALATNACAPATTPSSPITVRGDREVGALRYSVDGAVGDMTVCPPGLALVTANGGVRAAGVDAWVVEPGLLPITSFGCDDDGRPTALLAGRQLVRFPEGLGGAKVEVLTALPAGKFRHLTTADGVTFIWGSTDDGRWRIERHGPEGRQPVWSGKRRVAAVAPAGATGLVAAIGKDVLLFRPGAKPARLTQLSHVDGLAAATDGALFASTPDGVLELRKKDDHLGASWLLRGIHGPLRLRGEALFVLWREGGQVVRVVPSTKAR